MDPNEMQILWMVPYKAGTVTAVAYRNGKKIARQSVTTASKPAGLKLTLESKKIKANRRMLQATDQSGKITITGKSEGLKPHSQTVVCE